MKIVKVESTMVKLISAKPTSTMRVSNLDLIIPPNYHVPIHHFYRHNGSAMVNFFDTEVVKTALSRALVEFYPLAGRLKKSGNNRIEIHCNGEGALFVEAEADGNLDDFTPGVDVTFVPRVDYSKGISSYPILLAQMTRFKCGGVCLGVAIEHLVVDALSAIRFISTWSDMARGNATLIPPFLDRTVLRARDPPKPEFAHIEYDIPEPVMENPQLDSSNGLSPQTKFSVFKLTRDQLNALKAKCKEDEGDGKTNYSTFEVLAGHIWRSVSVARGLPENQETRLNIPIDGRSRLQPPLPPGYFGNAVFSAVPVASCGELGSNPLKYAIEKVHDSLVRMDDEYMRSALDYLEVQDDLKAHARGGNPFKSPNLGIISWARLPLYDADFGWGRPAYAGLGIIPSEGGVIVMPSPLNDGGLHFAISMVEEHTKIFEKLLYDDI